MSENIMPEVIWAYCDEDGDRRRWGVPKPHVIPNAAKYIRADEAPGLTDLQQMRLRIVELAAEAGATIKFRKCSMTGEPNVKVNDGQSYLTLFGGIYELEEMLRPNWPTMEETVAQMRKCKTDDDIWDLWEDTLNSWDAAEKWEAEHGQ